MSFAVAVHLSLFLFSLTLFFLCLYRLGAGWECDGGGDLVDGCNSSLFFYLLPFFLFLFFPFAYFLFLSACPSIYSLLCTSPLPVSSPLLLLFSFPHHFVFFICLFIYLSVSLAPYLLSSLSPFPLLLWPLLTLTPPFSSPLPLLLFLTRLSPSFSLTFPTHPCHAFPPLHPLVPHCLSFSSPYLSSYQPFLLIPVPPLNPFRK